MKLKLIRLLMQKLNSENPIVKKLVDGMIWSVFGTILSKMFLMVASIITARILGVDKNGEYGVISSTVSMFSTFAGLGLGTTATRFVAEYKKSNVKKCGKIIGLTNLVGIISGCVMAIILFILAPWLAKEQLNAPQLSLGLKLASIMLITDTFNSIQISTISGFEHFKSIAKLSAIQGIIALPIYIGFTILLGVNGLLIGHIITSCIILALYEIENYKVRKMYGIHIDVRGGKQEIGIIWKFSLPSMLSNVMVGPMIWLGNTFITSMDKGYFELGIFNAANQWRSVLTFLPSAVGNVILPLIIQNKGNDRLERFNILFGWIIVDCFAIPILAYPKVITFLYGGEYAGKSLDISLMIIVLTCCVLSFLDGISRNVVSNNLMWWGALSNGIWGGTFLVVLWNVRNFGAIGISFSYFISYVIIILLFIPFYIRRKVVHKSLLISKEIILMWLALILQVFITALNGNVIMKVTAVIISIISLWRVSKIMFTTSKLE